MDNLLTGRKENLSFRTSDHLADRISNLWSLDLSQTEKKTEEETGEKLSKNGKQLTVL